MILTDVLPESKDIIERNYKLMQLQDVEYIRFY